MAGDEVDDVEPVFGVGGRGGVEAPDPPFPDELPGVGVEGAGPAAVVDEVEPAGDVDRRELEQRPAGVAPEFAEGRLDALGGQVPGAGPVEPEERPVDGFRLRLRRLLRLERDVGVVDVGRALEQLVGEQRAAGHQQDRGDDRGDRLPPVVLPGLHAARQPPRFQAFFTGAAPRARRSRNRRSRAAHTVAPRLCSPAASRSSAPRHGHDRAPSREASRRSPAGDARMASPPP